MSTQLPPRDGNTPVTAPGILLADEEVLRSTFLAEYPTLSAEATQALGPEAAGLSPKVVEGAFVRAWDARTKFTTPVELHDFLVQDVHHAAARALSRRAAAHRFAGHDNQSSMHTSAETTPDQSWKHIQEALHGQAHSPSALAEQAKVSRHEAAEHIAVMTKGTSVVRPLLFGLAVVSLVAAAAFWIERAGADGRIATSVNAADARVVTSLPSQIGVVTLDDGSKVRLAPESKLSIPKEFGPKLRAVKIEGVGAFEVAPGQALPFRVYARNAAILATGTAFTVRAYPTDDAVTVAVTEGAVDVRLGKESHPVAAGAGLIIKNGTPARAATEDERHEADGWRSGTIAITNRPLREVLPQLKRWYGVSINVEKDNLLDKTATFQASIDSLMQAIHGVEKSTGLEFGYVGQNPVFREPVKKGAEPPKKGAKK